MTHDKLKFIGHCFFESVGVLCAKPESVQTLDYRGSYISKGPYT